MSRFESRTSVFLLGALKPLVYILIVMGVIVFAFGQIRLAHALRLLSYIIFAVWNVTYFLWWWDWERASDLEHTKVKPKTSDAYFGIIETVSQFSSAGITAVSILLPTDAVIVGFFFDKRPIGGLLEAAFYLTVSLAVAMWNLARLPTMAHKEHINVAYNRWTGYFQMLQLSTLMLGILRLLIALFTSGGE